MQSTESCYINVLKSSLLFNDADLYARILQLMPSSRSGALWAFLLCTVAGAAHAQFVPQNGLLYWCSLSENGSNMASLSFPSLPRTTWLSAYATGSYSRMCHYQFIQSSNQPYTFSNGSSYPQNNDGQVYATNPNACMVRSHFVYPGILV